MLFCDGPLYCASLGMDPLPEMVGKHSVEPYPVPGVLHSWATPRDPDTVRTGLDSKAGPTPGPSPCSDEWDQPLKPPIRALHSPLV